MDSLSYKTKFVFKENDEREWFVVDAEGQTLGRLCTRIASVLRGKHKPSFTPNSDCGDYVIVLNANKVHLSGGKWNDKVYLRYTGYPGGQKSLTARELNDRNPIGLVENAVRGMLPKNKLGRAQFKKLFAYEGTEHPHEAQKPKKLEL